MTTPPRLAVVVTCHDYEAYVGEAIASVLAQGRDDVELVVVDDGSTDGSRDVIATYPAARSVTIPNGGSVAACVVGLDMTTAPFVLFLDADDRLDPGSLAKVLDRLDPEVAKLQFSLGRIDADGAAIGPAQPPMADYRERERLAAEVLRTGVYLTPTTSGNVFRRDVADLLREVDYPDAAADGVTVFAAPFLGDVVSVSEELGRYRIHGRNVSAIGRAPTAAGLDREARRFADVTGHLRAVLARTGASGRLPPTSRLYVYRERDFCRTVAAGRRPSPLSLPGILASLAPHHMPTRNKLAMAFFFALATLAPPSRAKALLDYRYRTSGRTLGGFLRTAIAPAPRPGATP